jgi:hypothetical protein
VPVYGHYNLSKEEIVMQIDMHYGAVYYLAIFAGVSSDEAIKIACSSQLVDDAKFGGTVQFCDGDGCICNNSAHANLTDNLSAHARLVWIPYHFVPELTTRGTFLEKLKCVKDSSLARSAIEEAIEERDSDIRPYRFGVALHAYADTWSHYGFSGIASDTNLVKHVRPLDIKQNPLEWVETKFGNLVGYIKGSRMNPIGHLFAETCPDLPYLKWQYAVVGTNSPPIMRNNQNDFREALESIYQYMLQYLGTRPVSGIPAPQKVVFDQLLSMNEDNGEKRLSKWAEMFKKKFNMDIPEYEEQAWIDNSFGKVWKKDVCMLLDSETSLEFKKSDYWRFCRGLSKHGNYIVGRLAQNGIELV